MLDYPSTILSPRGLPWATLNRLWESGGRSPGKSWNGLDSVLTDSETLLAQCQGHHHGQIGFGFTVKGLLWVVGLSPQPRPGDVRSLPVAN